MPGSGTSVGSGRFAFFLRSAERLEENPGGGIGRAPDQLVEIRDAEACRRLVFGPILVLQLKGHREEFAAVFAGVLPDGRFDRPASVVRSVAIRLDRLRHRSTFGHVLHLIESWVGRRHEPAHPPVVEYAETERVSFPLREHSLRIRILKKLERRGIQKRRVYSALTKNWARELIERMDRLERRSDNDGWCGSREPLEGGGRAGEGASGIEAARLPERARFETEFSREVTIRYRGQALACDEVRNPKNAAELVRKIIGDDSKEHVVALYLDGRHRAIGHAVVSIGTATSSLVHPREVFQPGVLVGAVAVIIAHNHPSGETSPSAEDAAVTKRLAEAGTILGIKLLDSLVVTREGGYYSFEESRPELFLR